MGLWFQCADCVFGTNSPKAARVHEASSGHDITQEDDE